MNTRKRYNAYFHYFPEKTETESNPYPIFTFMPDCATVILKADTYEEFVKLCSKLDPEALAAMPYYRDGTRIVKDAEMDELIIKARQLSVTSGPQEPLY